MGTAFGPDRVVGSVGSKKSDSEDRYGFARTGVLICEAGGIVGRK